MRQLRLLELFRTSVGQLKVVKDINPHGSVDESQAEFVPSNDAVTKQFHLGSRWVRTD